MNKTDTQEVIAEIIITELQLYLKETTRVGNSTFKNITSHACKYALMSW